MDRANLLEWTEMMCRVGFEHDCEFDGWGTLIDQSQIPIISSTFQSYAIPKPDSMIVKLQPALTIDELWIADKEAVSGLETSRGNVRNGLDFEDYVTLSHREEDLSQYQ